MDKCCIIFDTYDNCFEVGIYEKTTVDKEEIWAYWLKHKRSMYTSMCKVIVIATSCLGEWK